MAPGHRQFAFIRHNDVGDLEVLDGSVIHHQQDDPARSLNSSPKNMDLADV